MPRPGVSTAMATGLAAQSVLPVLLVELHLNSGVQYCWSGVGSIVWNGQTWQGVGAFGAIGDVVESEEIAVNGMQLSLQGIPYTDLNGAAVDPVEQALSECQQSNPVILYFGLFDNAAGALVVDPVIAFSGRMDKIQIEEGAETVTITMNVEPQRVDINRDRDRRYADQDQRLNYPTDSGFKQVTDLMSWSGAMGVGSAHVPTLPGKVGGGGAWTTVGGP